MESLRPLVEDIGFAIDFAGVAVIVLGLLFALARFMRRAPPECGRYAQLRQDIGRGILLGLELLVAGDIIRTVAIAPTLDSVLVLAVIVVIRTFLSMSLSVELEGRWPWQRDRAGVRDPERAV